MKWRKRLKKGAQQVFMYLVNVNSPSFPCGEKHIVHHDICLSNFVEALFVAAKNDGLARSILRFLFHEIYLLNSIRIFKCLQKVNENYRKYTGMYQTCASIVYRLSMSRISNVHIVY